MRYLVGAAKAVKADKERFLVLLVQILDVHPHPFFRMLMEVCEIRNDIQSERSVLIVCDVHLSVLADAHIHLYQVISPTLLFQFFQRIAPVQSNLVRPAAHLEPCPQRIDYQQKQYNDK